MSVNKIMSKLNESKPLTYKELVKSYGSSNEDEVVSEIVYLLFGNDTKSIKRLMEIRKDLNSTKPTAYNPMSGQEISDDAIRTCLKKYFGI